MTDEKTQILIRALEASGSEREAQLARAILGNPATAQADAAPAESPGQAYARAQQEQAAAQAGEQVPAGLMTREELAEYEAHPTRPRSYAERAALAETVAASFDYHEGRR